MDQLNLSGQEDFEPKKICSTVIIVLNPKVIPREGKEISDFYDGLLFNPVLL